MRSAPNRAHAVIQAKFHIKHRDNLPLTGWAGWRGQIPEIFQELGFTRGAEIGVGEGEFSEQICKLNPSLELLCIDPWAVDPFYADTEAAEKAHETAKARLSPYNAKIMRMPSLGAVHVVADRSLDFVYIDGLRDFDSAMQDIVLWAPKIRTGGIMCGHAFSHMCTPGGGGMVFAVEAYTRAHAINPWYLAHRDFQEPSWLWVG